MQLEWVSRMTWECLAIVILLCAAPTPASTATLPRLYLSLEPPVGIPTEPMNGVASVPRNQRFHFYLVLETPSLDDRFEDLRVPALNQVRYESTSPPPNVTLRVFSVEEERAGEVPVRIVCSGGGNEMNFYFQDVELDIVALPADVLKDASKSPADRERLVRGMTQSSMIPVANPPGLYEIRAEYKPSTPENWRGLLTAPPVRFRVEEP